MIGEIDPRGYDCEGRVTLLPGKKSMQFRPTAAMGTFLSSELQSVCSTFDEVRQFLRTCRYVSDFRQFGVADYWMNPEDFERVRKGDCEDFALWTWRQLLSMGLQARFVIGRAGYGRSFHAWVTYAEDGVHYLVEPLARRRKKLSRLMTLMYEPIASVSADERRLVYHQHQPRDYKPTLSETLAIAGEWIPLVLYRSVLSLIRLPWAIGRRVVRSIFRRDESSVSRPGA